MSYLYDFLPLIQQRDLFSIVSPKNMVDLLKRDIFHVSGTGKRDTFLFM